MDAQPLYDLSPLLRMALLAGGLALGPLAWWWLRHREGSPARRLRALTVLTLFLTFDLVVFGAFTRLSDSGLGCPDWPGCYGSASPLGARDEIHAAQSVRPSGPVTHGKAWVEMIHRYLATTVGVLIIAMALASWREALRARATISPWWATATLVWVCAQGAFGALTVTLKLFPAIVTAHLLGGIGLLALLAVQAELQQPRPLALTRAVRRALAGAAALVLLQVALGGWVSTNYAVLACQEFPTCQGSWWPAMDFQHGFALWRELGETKHGDYLPFAALTAIHYTHRLMAYAVFAALLGLAWALHRSGAADARRVAAALLAMAFWQLLSGLSNVVLGWPLLAALAHTAGAAVLVAAMAVWLTRAVLAREASPPVPALGATARAML